MASYRYIEVKPLAGALGAEIGGIDLRRLGDEAFTEIRAAWLEHLVVFFRDQKITPEEQIAFAERFGAIHYHPFMKGIDEHPEILEIVKEQGDTRAFGEVWHTDQMFSPRPAKATILYAKETPDVGGDTMFANMYLAYETLSEPMKALLAKVKTWNVGDRRKMDRGERVSERMVESRGPREGRYIGNATMAAKVRDPGEVETEAAHPLVRTHPETGRKSLYIGNHTQTLYGFRPAEARPLLEFLMTHAVQPELTCRLRWEVGSLAIWDNRCTQHRALNDYHGKRRRMHRITIAGDAPF
jgi:taurine dioxygenase